MIQGTITSSAMCTMVVVNSYGDEETPQKKARWFNADLFICQRNGKALPYRSMTMLPVVLVDEVTIV